MVKEKIGIALLMLGMSGGGSDNLLIPIAVMAVGAWLMRGLLN